MADDLGLDPSAGTLPITDSNEPPTWSQLGEELINNMWPKEYIHVLDKNFAQGARSEPPKHQKHSTDSQNFKHC